MDSKWPEVSIEEIKASSRNAIAMGPFGSRIKAENFVEDGVPVIKGGNLTGDFIVEDKFDFLSEEKADELKASNAFRRDIVITHRGTIGQVGIIPDDSKFERYVVSQSQLKVTLDKEKVNPYFIYYFLRSPVGQHRLLMNASQVGVPAIAQASTSVKSIMVPYPEKEIQNKIVEIILGLDHKIHKNRQINQTLEAMAQAIFKSWFVDFEPVKAKISAIEAGEDAEGVIRAAMCAISGKTNEELDQLQAKQPENYIQLKTTAKLFPSSMLDSDFGEIPERWEVNHLGKFLDILETGQRPKGGVSKITEGVPSVGAENIIGIGNYDYGKEKFVSREFFEKLNRGKIEPEDVLLYKDGGKPGDFRPRVSYFGFGFPYSEFAINEHVFRLRSEILGQPFLYLSIGHERSLADLRQKGGKAAIPGINQTEVKTVLMLRPTSELLNCFNVLVGKIFEKILKNSLEIFRLATLRDTLLPKLLSGELSIGISEFM